jgi:hypothetical protein
MVLLFARVGRAQLVTDGLVGYWPLDEATVQGKDVKDAWGKNHGTVNGKLKAVAGQVGGAQEFDGSAAVEIPGTETLSFAGKDQMTVMAWVNAASESPVVGVVAGCCGTIVAQRDAEAWALRFDGRNAGQEMEFIVQPGWQGDGGFGVKMFKAKEWHHLVGVVNKKEMIYYLDGVEKNRGPYAGPMAGNSTETEIGRAGDGGFVGIIDEVLIYDRALSDKDVKQAFAAKGLAVRPAGKLATGWAAMKAAGR